MSENGSVTVAEETTAEAVETIEETPEVAEAEPVQQYEISYHAVEKEGTVTAIWEMQGPVHLRTIGPRSSEGQKILSLFETAA